MNPHLPPEVLCATGYAVFLTVVAAGLERLARHVHRRAQQFRVAGFSYHRPSDTWLCPTGQRLHRTGADPERRVVRYRAPAHVCNGCGCKARCTDSDQGREIAHASFAWLETEVGRFHRGLSLALQVLALLILGIEMVRFERPVELLALGSVFAAVYLAARRSSRTFFGGASRLHSGAPFAPPAREESVPEAGA